MSLQVSTWILGILGLTSIAEFFVEGLPAIAQYYLDGISIAWEGIQGDYELSPYSRDDPFAQQRATNQIALGHVEVVVLLLGAIVDYLTRGRGNAHVLAQQMRASAKGVRLGEWMLKHEDALKSRPDLQTSAARKGAAGRQEPPPNPPSGKDNEPTKGKSYSMPLHQVECFKANNLPVSKYGEFERQLKGQETGLNRLTVEEYLENIANPIRRNSAAATRARKVLRDKLQRRFQKEYMATMDVFEAGEAAINKTKETMSSLAGLHNPDLSAGSKDFIADFGDRRVNSSIGPQWRNKIQALKQAVEAVPESLRSSTFLNVNLHKC